MEGVEAELRKNLEHFIEHGDADGASKSAIALALLKKKSREVSDTPGLSRSKSLSIAIPIVPAGSPIKLTTCKVVGCKAGIEIDGYCREHHAIFNAVESKEAKKLRIKREKEAKKAQDKMEKLKKKQLKTAGPRTLEGHKFTGGGSSQHMEAELRETWKDSRRVVFKDLPRLARRITVQTDKLGVVLDCGRKIEGGSKAQAQKAKEGKDGSSSTPETGSLAELKDGKSTSTPDVKEQPGVQTPEVLYSVEVKQHDKDPKKVGDQPEEEDKPATTWDAICMVVSAVAQHLEEKAVFDKVNKAIEDLSAKANGANVDLQIVTQDLFQAIGENTSTFHVFKAIHQGVLFPAIATLHAKLYSQLGRMKDVRRPDGWKVHIFLGEAVYVTHTRWEQSLADPNTAEHFEVNWELRLSFDRRITDLKATFLRIQQLRLHPDMTKERKAEIVDVLRGNGYLVSA